MKKKFVLSAAMIAALGLAGTAQAAQTPEEYFER